MVNLESTLTPASGSVNTTGLQADRAARPSASVAPARLPAGRTEPALALERFRQALESGEQAFLAEHRLVGLVRRLVPGVRWPLIEAALRQYAENEHRLLIVHRAVQLMDETDGWRYAEPLLRSTVQYLASRPDTCAAEQALELADGLGDPPREGPLDERAALDLTDRLVACAYGEEVALLLEAVRGGLADATLLEALALAGSTMLLRSGWDAHAVTGLHSVLDLLREARAPEELRRLARLVGLSSQRTRRQKAVRDSWAGLPEPIGGPSTTLEEVTASVLSDASGLEAASAARSYLLQGGDAEALVVRLMEIALETSGPFEVLHNVKMLWGLYGEYRQSRWRSAGATWRPAPARSPAASTRTPRPPGPSWRCGPGGPCTTRGATEAEERDGARPALRLRVARPLARLPLGA